MIATSHGSTRRGRRRYPDVPILGFTNHTDTAGLRRAHAAGFDQVVAKSALFERAPEVIGELLASVE